MRGAPELAGPIVLFDGACGLCDRTVQWLIAHDSGARLRFAALDSRCARDLLRQAARAGTGRLPPAGTLVYVSRAGWRIRSAAFVAIMRHLPAPWRWACLCALVPRWWRDGVYKIIAAKRIAWFGARDACRLPDAALRTRLLADSWPTAGAA